MQRMKNRIKSWLPTPDSLRSNRWLRWMGPVLADPRLWHFSRKGIALGVALGIFFGLLIPVAQMPASALFAVILRANLPMAVASTLVSNPVTFGPVYYGAYRLGQAVLGEPAISDEDALKTLADDPADTVAAQKPTQRIAHWMQRLGDVGKPLAIGLAIVATTSGLAVYVLISGLWVLKTRWTRRQRLRGRASAR